MAGFVIWVTGISGAGKTTIAKNVIKKLKEEKDQALKLIHLDGDELRKVLISNNQINQKHDYNSRIELALIYSKLCKLLAEQDFNVIISTISLFKKVHKWNRANISNYFEVFIKVPIEEIIKRDPKNIYKNYKSGKIRNVYGIDLKVEEPENPDCLLSYKDGMSVDKMSNILISEFKKKCEKL